ncbi:hypothetical protein JW948_18815 [bacterium]|nr:hypothetical protein [bacterium]
MNMKMWTAALLVLQGICTGYERSSMPNLITPSELEARQLVFSVMHRFNGLIDEDPLENFLGMDQGANVGLGLRFCAGRGFEFKAMRRLVYPKETGLGLSYRHAFDKIKSSAQIDIQMVSFRSSFLNEDRETDWFLLFSMQANPLEGRISPVCNIGYDHFNEHAGIGLGLSIRLTEHIHMQGEYAPSVIEKDGLNQNSFSVGLKLLTYGHHFLLMAGNNTEIGPRHTMLGTRTRDLTFGFNILRIIEF